MLEEVLKLIVFQQSSLGKDVEDLIISIKENIEKSDQLNNSDLTPLDKFQTELELKLSIDSNLKKLQIKLSSLKLKQFHRICNVILSKAKPELVEEELILESKVTTIKSEKVSEPIKVTEPVPGIAKVRFLVYEDERFLVDELVVKEPKPGVFVVPNDFTGTIEEDFLDQKKKVVNPYSGVFASVFEKPENFFESKFFRKLTGSIGGKRLKLSDLNPSFSKESDIKLSDTDLIAGIDIGGTPTNLLTIAFSNKSSGIQMGSAKIFEVSKKYSNLFSRKIGNIEPLDMKLISDGIKDITDNLFKRFSKRKVKAIALGIVGGVDLSKPSTVDESVFQYFFRVMVEELLNSQFYLILCGERHTSQVDPTNGELACDADVKTTKLKRHGHKATLSSGNVVDADLNAAYNIIRIVRPFTKVSYSDNTYNLIRLTA
jgi:hypothetical protein